MFLAIWGDIKEAKREIMSIQVTKGFISRLSPPVQCACPNTATVYQAISDHKVSIRSKDEDKVKTFPDFDPGRKRMPACLSNSCPVLMAPVKRKGKQLKSEDGSS